MVLDQILKGVGGSREDFEGRNEDIQIGEKIEALGLLMTEVV